MYLSNKLQSDTRSPLPCAAKLTHVSILYFHLLVCSACFLFPWFNQWLSFISLLLHKWHQFHRFIFFQYLFLFVPSFPLHFSKFSPFPFFLISFFNCVFFYIHLFNVIPSYSFPSWFSYVRFAAEFGNSPEEKRIRRNGSITLQHHRPAHSFDRNDTCHIIVFCKLAIKDKMKSHSSLYPYYIIDELFGALPDLYLAGVYERYSETLIHGGYERPLNLPCPSSLSIPLQYGNNHSC